MTKQVSQATTCFKRHLHCRLCFFFSIAQWFQCIFSEKMSTKSSAPRRSSNCSFGARVEMNAKSDCDLQCKLWKSWKMQCVICYCEAQQSQALNETLAALFDVCACFVLTHGYKQLINCHGKCSFIRCGRQFIRKLPSSMRKVWNHFRHFISVSLGNNEEMRTICPKMYASAKNQPTKISNCFHRVGINGTMSHTKFRFVVHSSSTQNDQTLPRKRRNR